MSKVYLEDSTLTNIANAIRAKAGNSTQLLPSEMPAAITALPSGGGGGGGIPEYYIPIPAAQREEEEKKQLPYTIIALEQEIQDLTDLFTKLMVKVDVEELLKVREELKNGNN